MSARIQSESSFVKQPQAALQAALLKSSGDAELESILRNYDEKNLVAPLRDLHASPGPASNQKLDAALALQQKWERWLVQRELLRNEVKRGRELLQQIEQELADLRDRLEDWPAFERICGKNPVLEYMDSISAHEKLKDFLPDWLQRREAQLHRVDRDLQQCARKNGLEHLL